MPHTIQVGHPLIDNQHAELLSCIRRLQALATATPDWESVSEQLCRVTTLTSVHFETEEQLMAQYRMPAERFDAHREDHRRIMEEVADFHLNAMRGHRKSIESIARMVHDWIVDHLHEFDRHLIPLLATGTVAQGNGTSGFQSD